MYISGINGYLSKFEGTEVDAAVERVQGLDAELALKVDKTTTINDIPLTNNIVLTAEDIGAMPIGTGYGKSLSWNENILSLLDQEGRVLSNAYIEIDQGRWGHIIGDLNDQTDLKLVLDSKQPMITPEAMLSSDLVDDTGHVHKFATAEQLAQIETNKNNIATNAANIATNTADIATNRSNIATNTADIATNKSNIATNTADIATNRSNIATNTADIATNRSNIATNTADIATINSKIPEQASASNKLADKDFVNSSIATSTATFIGTFNSLEDLEDYTGPLDDNDYAFVITTDAAGNTLYNRYKYTGSEWLFEYTLNNSSFTAAQWASIQSGITSTDVAQITTNKNDIATINGTLSGFGNIVTHNVDEFATAAQGAKADTALQSIDSAMVVAALGYTPYNSTNPAGYISGITDSMVVAALGYTPYDASNPDGFISGIDSTDVVNALGYTPYDASNPDGYISSASISSLTDVLLTNVTNNQALLYNTTTQKWENKDIVISIAWGDITGTLADQTDLQQALDGKQPTITGAATTITDNDLTAGRALISDNSGKVATSSISTTKLGYLSDVTSNIQVQLNGKYDASNPDGFISSASVDTLADVTLTNVTDGEVLRYNATSQKWENAAAGSATSLDTLTDVEITSPTQGQNLTYDAVNNKWINTTSSATVGWGGITGNIEDQTDLKNALDSKASVTIRDWSAS